jgi:putative cardiolipin synthase
MIDGTDARFTPRRAMTTHAAPTSPLQGIIAPLLVAHPGLDGVYALHDGRSAFAARMLLADTATCSLDLQYYIWHGDRTGTLLFDAVRRAADRGVRVRVLLDDTNTWGVETLLATLDAHPNIEVRLFNPLRPPRWRVLGMLTDFRRLNRRMHNKSFTADGAVTIVGGRNIGDEYFEAGEEVDFADLGVLVVGPVVADVQALFERFWTSRHSVPLVELFSATRRAARVDLGARATEIEREPATVEYRRVLRLTTLAQDLLSGALPFEWTGVRLVADEPVKFDRPPESAPMIASLRSALGVPQRELQVISSYFVPTAGGVWAFADLARRGVRVHVLTNALEATDVAAVHAGYAKHRRPLLRAGVTLFEWRSDGSTRGRRLRVRGFVQASAASLHAKALAVDGERAYVGSFNLDPRSAALNTEMGFVIDSPALARGIARAFEARVPEAAYAVRLAPDGRSLRWIERTPDGEVIHTREPGAGLARGVLVRVLSWLPVEWLL